MPGANPTTPHDDIDRAIEDAIDAWLSAEDVCAIYREVAGHLAAHLRRIVAAGDEAARSAKYYPTMGIVSANADRMVAYRRATIAAGMSLARIEKALGERLSDEPTSEQPMNGSVNGSVNGALHGVTMEL